MVSAVLDSPTEEVADEQCGLIGYHGSTFVSLDADIGSMESELGIHLVEVTSNSEGLLRAVYHAQRAGFPILSTLC